MNFEAPLTSLVWITSVVSIALTYVISYFMIPDLGGDPHAVVEAGDDYFLRNAGRRGDSRIGEGIHFDGIAARAGSGERRRRKAARRWEFCRDSWPAISRPIAWV